MNVDFKIFMNVALVFIALFVLIFLYFITLSIIRGFAKMFHAQEFVYNMTNFIEKSKDGLTDFFGKTKYILIIGFVLIIVIYGFIDVKSLNKPIEFKTELEKREDSVKMKLLDIRDLQVAYKDKYGQFTGNFDTLISFFKTDSLVEISRNYTDGWDPDKYTERDGIRFGFIKISEIKTSVKDSLKNRLEYPIEQIKYIPYTDGKIFTMGAGEVETASKVTVKVFEVYALYEDFLQGMDEQLTDNYIFDRKKIVNFEGLKIGSLTDATNNAANWEN